MKLLILVMLLVGCTPVLKTEQPVRLGIIHDYIFSEGIEQCKLHDGLHYIVVDETISDMKDDRKPCNGTFIFSCQNAKKIKFNSEASYCFISEIQIDDALNMREE
jgi:hypothetical protein